MDPAIWELLRSARERRLSEVEAIMRLAYPGASVPGVRFVARFGDVVTCRLRPDDVKRVRADPRCRSLKAARTIGPEPSSPRGGAGDLESERWRSVPPGDPTLTGAGVVVGVVDWDCAFAHEAFRRAGVHGPGLGDTRLLALWDQRGRRTALSPRPYGYGRCHDAARLNAALREPDPYAALGYRLRAAGHGTHVMGIAAGNGVVGPPGPAREADLVFVHLADRDSDGLRNLGDSVRILEAVDFVARVAGRRPWVVNLSVGRQGGPKDGTTLTELGFDNILSTAANLCIVQSGGNYADRSIHVFDRVHVGRTTSVTACTHADDQTANEFEIWYSGADEFEVRVVSPAGRGTRWVGLDARALVVADGSQVGRLYHRCCDPNNGDNQVELFLDPWAPPGPWIIELRGRKVIDGTFHAWVERDEACVHCQARFTGAHVSPRVTLGTLASSHLPIVVGAIDDNTPDRQIARFSSSGPTRDGRLKPDLVAPGVNVLSARSPTGVIAKSGSSMASPHVAGAVAVCLQASPVPLDIMQIRDLLLGTADPPPPDPIDAPRYGAGYLNLEALVSAVRDLPLATRRPVPTQGQTMNAQPGTDGPFDPDRVYQSLVYGGGAPSGLGHRYTIVALPGEPPRSRPEPGDRLVRVVLGETGLGRVAVLSDATLATEQATAIAALPAERGGPGYYAKVADLGAPGAVAPPFMARRVLDRHARMPLGQLLLRPIAGGLDTDQPAIESAETDETTVMIQAGLAENPITNALLYARHPKMTGQALRPGTALAREWRRIRDQEVRPAVRRSLPRDPVDPVELATFLSQYEDDKRVPADVKKRFLTDPALTSAGRSLRDRVLANWRSGRPPLTPIRLYELAHELTGDAGTAMLLCHNVTKAFARGGTAILWQSTSREGEYHDGQKTYRAEKKHSAGRLTYFHRGKNKTVTSIFYLLFSAATFGTDDFGDWYHFFVTATLTAYGSTGSLTGGGGSAGRREAEDDRKGDVPPVVYTSILGDALRDVEKQLTDAALRGAAGYRGWVLANVLSFLEGGHYGKDYTQGQSDVIRESKVHLQGAIFGLKTVGGRPGQGWRFHVPKAGSVGKEDLVLGFSARDKTAEMWDPEGRRVTPSGKAEDVESLAELESPDAAFLDDDAWTRADRGLAEHDFSEDEESITVDDVAAEMDGLRCEFVLAYTATRAAGRTRGFSQGSVHLVESWNGTADVAVVDGFPVRKVVLTPRPDVVASVRRYDVPLEAQRAAVVRNLRALADWLAREPAPGADRTSWLAERRRLEDTLARRRVIYSRLWVRQMMYNRFDPSIARWTRHYNDKFSPRTDLDPNVVKSMLHQESRMGTAGRHLMLPPYDWSSSDQHPVRSRFNVGQAVDSWGPQQWLMMQEMAPALYRRHGLDSLEAGRRWFGMTNRDYAEHPTFMAALREFFEHRDGGRNLMGAAGRDLHQDYDFWIRTAVRWLFVKYTALSNPSWREALRSYNGDGPRARRYRDEVLARVGASTPFAAWESEDADDVPSEVESSEPAVFIGLGVPSDVEVDVDAEVDTESGADADLAEAGIWSDEERAEPAHIQKARRLWAKHFTKPDELKRVELKNLADAPSKHINASGYHAWTNSPTEIYIAPKADAEDGLLLVVLYHESLHVSQFHEAGGKPPATYTKMVEYELDAYPKTAVWARAHADPNVRRWASSVDDATTLFRRLRKEVEKEAPKDAIKQEQSYKAALLKHGELPKRTEIKDLYRTVP